MVPQCNHILEPCWKVWAIWCGFASTLKLAAGGTLSNWNLAAKQSFQQPPTPSYSIIAPAKQRGEGDKSQGRVYEMSSGECKRMIRDATGCNAVRRGRSRCNQMSFKDVTWLVARLLPGLLLQGRGGRGGDGGWENISWGKTRMTIKWKCWSVMTEIFQSSQVWSLNLCGQRGLLQTIDNQDDEDNDEVKNNDDDHQNLNCDIDGFYDSLRTRCFSLVMAFGGIIVTKDLRMMTNALIVFPPLLMWGKSIVLTKGGRGAWYGGEKKTKAEWWRTASRDRSQ